jgi:hypothetical protein
MNQSRKELLAYEIATTLKDKEISLFLSYTEKHPEEVLRELLDKVMATPADRIKKSRAAYFVHLVTQYERRNRNNNRY